MPLRADGPHPAASRSEAAPHPPPVDYDAVACALAGGLAHLWRARRAQTGAGAADGGPPTGTTREPSPGTETRRPRKPPAAARRAPAA
jgi:hypothetical protein